MFKKVLLVSLFVSVGFSQTLPFLVNKAINNKLVVASKNELEATKLDYDSLKSSYLPSLHISSNYANTSNETPSQANKSFDTSIKAIYNLYDGGKKTNTYDAFKSKIQMHDLNLSDLQNRVALNVITSYFNYLSLKESKKAKLQEIKQLEKQYEKQKRFFETQTIAIDEVEKIMSRLENTNVSLQEIELDMQTILHTLEYIVGEKVSIENGSFIKNIDNKTIQLRADIKALEFQMKNIKSNAKAQKNTLYPQVNLENKFTYYDVDYNNKAFDPNVDTQNTLMVNLSWKIFDFDATKKTYQANMKRYLALKSQYEYEKNKMNVDLKLAHKAYDIAKLKIKSASASLKSANSTYGAIEDKYQNSLVDNVAYLEALSEKYNALSILNSTKYDLEIKKANIVFHSGKSLQEFIK